VSSGSRPTSFRAGGCASATLRPTGSRRPRLRKRPIIGRSSRCCFLARGGYDCQIPPLPMSAGIGGHVNCSLGAASIKRPPSHLPVPRLVLHLMARFATPPNLSRFRCTSRRTNSVLVPQLQLDGNEQRLDLSSSIHRARAGEFRGRSRRRTSTIHRPVSSG